MKNINLASGGTYFKSPAVATEAAIRVLHEGKNVYGSVEGSIGLRQAICKRFNTAGLSVSPEQVMVTPGVKQGLFNLFSVLLQTEEDEVLVPTPAWFGFNEMIAYSKGRLTTIATQAADDYALTPEMLEAALTEKTRILILTNPANPTGRIYTKPELETLLKVASRYPDLYIISDEIYDDVTYTGPVPCILSCEGATERCIVVNGFSKSFAMMGWRIGYMVAEASLIQKCIAFQKATLSGLSEFVQEGARATLENREEVLSGMQQTLTENRLIAQNGLQAIPEVKFYLPDGAYYFFPDFSSYLGRRTFSSETIETSIDLCHYLKTHYNLELLPGDYFGSPGHARMSFAVEKSELEDALKRLKQALILLEKTKINQAV